MHPRHFATSAPDRVAAVMSDGSGAITYGSMEGLANRGAQLFRRLGLETGDGVAVLLENRTEYLAIYWAAQRSGLYLTPISTRLTAAEAAYIVGDCGAKVLVTSKGAGDGALELVRRREEMIPGVTIFSLDAGLGGASDWAKALDACPAEPIADETAGWHMVYSSGTTGRPKGIRLPLTGEAPETPNRFTDTHRSNYGVGEHTIYLSPAPMYHTAPLAFCTTVERLGGTVVIMAHFEAEAFLQAVERWKITFTQVVPTMFVRMLKLPAEARRRYDLSSLTLVVHAAAPCPVPVKHAMIEWLGPIIYEYYGGSEGNGSTAITSEEWLRKPGSVGKANWGVIHVCDEEGRELGPNKTGLIYFEGGWDFQYHNDPGKTADSRHPLNRTWSTMGDIGHLDEDGYLFLTDRKAFMIISGGVNIYPQEAENILIIHPKVVDAAVFGVPHEEFGEEVKAVVQPVRWSDAGPELAAELMAFCKSQLASIKCPRSIDFLEELPRHPTGKLYKAALRQRYLQAADA